GGASTACAEGLAQVRSGLQHEVEDRVLFHAATYRVAAGAGGPDPHVIAPVGLAPQRDGRFLQVVRAGGVDLRQVRAPVVAGVARPIGVHEGGVGQAVAVGGLLDPAVPVGLGDLAQDRIAASRVTHEAHGVGDRKSTRLNSSLVNIS